MISGGQAGSRGWLPRHANSRDEDPQQPIGFANAGVSRHNNACLTRLLHCFPQFGVHLSYICRRVKRNFKTILSKAAILQAVQMENCSVSCNTLECKQADSAALT